jgi:glycosyltransferase involved in cell wall biosynthesis
MKKINFVLPALSTKPGGGTKIMYEYANRFSLKGYDVTVIHSIKRPFKKARTPLWLRHLLLRLKKKQTWFTFSPNVKTKLVKEITDAHMPDADVVISTWWQMTYAVADLSDHKGKKFNFIQDYEIWTGQEERVKESYKLGVQNIVIAKYLADLVTKISGQTPIHIPNAIDTGVFKLEMPIAERDPYSVIMLYSEEPRKGSSFGLEALMKVKEKCASLSVTFFSTFKRPLSLPDWIIFEQRPNNLPELYNRHAIFISPSIGEGWALPPAEAMACGCAVVCTNIGGHHDYAINNETAILVEPRDVEYMADSILRLINEPDIHKRLSSNGHSNITSQFGWDSSVKKMEDAFLKSFSIVVIPN